MAREFQAVFLLLAIITVTSASLNVNCVTEKCNCTLLTSCNTIYNAFPKDRKSFHMNVILYTEFIKTFVCESDADLTRISTLDWQMVKVCCPYEITKCDLKNQYTSFLKKFTEQNEISVSMDFQVNIVKKTSPNITVVKEQNINENRNIESNLECGRTLSSRHLKNGTTNRVDFPWLALLEYKMPQGNKFLCGGSLITGQVVLTAARCINDKLISVRLGEYDMDDSDECIYNATTAKSNCNKKTVDIGVQSAIVHDSFRPDESKLEFKNDVALVLLNHTAIFSPYIYPVCLPMRQSNAATFYVAGWSRSMKSSNVGLRRKTMSVLEDLGESCSKSKESNTFVSDQICVHKSEDGDNYQTCISDSGGPIMAEENKQDGQPRLTLYGISSMDISCSRTVFPYGLYTKIDKYIPWINFHLQTKDP